MDIVNNSVEARDYEIEASQLGKDTLEVYFQLRNKGIPADEAFASAKLMHGSAMVNGGSHD